MSNKLDLHNKLNPVKEVATETRLAFENLDDSMLVRVFITIVIIAVIPMIMRYILRKM